jgi:site-specific recombinase XerD
MKAHRDCETCGAPVGLKARTVCCRCWRRQQEALARQPCPSCGKPRVLTVTGRCVTCSHTCIDCGALVRLRDRERCQHCHRRVARRAQLTPCAACRRPRRIVDVDSGRCGTCAAAQRPRTRRPCVTCGRLVVHQHAAQCHACWQKDPDRPFVYLAGLLQRLDNPPEWLEEFAGYAAARFCPSRAVSILRDLGRLLDAGTASPTELLDKARWRQTSSIGPLARTLESFFLQQRMALPLDHLEELEARRRARRLAGVPAALRATVAAFADDQLATRDRSRRAGTRPRSHHTIDVGLCDVRNLANFLAEHHPAVTGWESVAVGHVEDFLTLRPGSRARRLTSLRTFFAWARKRRLVLVDPTKTLRTNARRHFQGPVLDQARQRELYQRWTGTDVHPHEALIGLLAMLHAASAAELRGLHTDDIDAVHRTVRLGHRPQPVPLDPATWAALQRCLTHRDQLRTVNGHVLVAKITSTRDTPASAYYISHALDEADVSVRTLRSNRLNHLVATTDPLLVIAALGLTPAAAGWYLADTVDPDRLANL